MVAGLQLGESDLCSQLPRSTRLCLSLCSVARASSRAAEVGRSLWKWGLSRPPLMDELASGASPVYLIRIVYTIVSLSSYSSEPRLSVSPSHHTSSKAIGHRPPLRDRVSDSPAASPTRPPSETLISYHFRQRRSAALRINMNEPPAKRLDQKMEPDIAEQQKRVMLDDDHQHAPRLDIEAVRVELVSSSPVFRHNNAAKLSSGSPRSLPLV